MSKELIVSASRHETRVAVLEEDQVVEIFYQREKEYSLAGSIHKGRVTRVLPGMQSAFVDIGLERDAFLYVSDFFEDNEEYDKIVTGVEEKVLRLEKNASSLLTSESESPVVAVETTSAPVEAFVAAPQTQAAPPPTTPSTQEREQRGNDRRDDRHRGGRGRRRGRRSGPGGGNGLPDSKYFSPRQTAETAPPATEPEKSSEVPVSNVVREEMVILPGESLAKYGSGESSRLEEPAKLQEENEAILVSEIEELADVEALEREQARHVEPETDTEQREPESDPEPEQEPALKADPNPAEPSFSMADVHVEKVAAVETLIVHGSPSFGEESPVAPAAAEQHPEGDGVHETESQTAAETETVAEETDTEDPASEPGESETGEFAEGSEAELETNEADATNGEEGPESARIPTSLTATLREQGARYPHRVSRRMRRKMRGGGAPGEERKPEERRGDQQGNSSAQTGEVRQQAQPQQEPREPRESREDSRAARPPLPSIADLLREGQEIIVQIAKEPLGQKGARITSHVALPGRFLVYMPSVDHIGVSRKIPSDEERIRLKKVLQTHRTGIPGGFIVRTAGEGRSEEELHADMMFLYNLWMDMRQKAEKRPAPQLMHHDLDLVQRVLRDQLTSAFKTVWVDNEELYESILRFVQRFQPTMVSRVKLYTRPTPIFDEFGITNELEKALRPKVWLKSGGYIVINQTEALVAIDINTGKYVGKSNRLEDTIVKTNTDAIKEIVRQIRLRDLGGIIVVDFIDMDERRNRQKVMQALEEAMRADRAPYKILQFNDFGLVAITRKRVKQSLERTLCMPCSYCEGAGYIKSTQTVIGEILIEAQKLAKVVDGTDVMLRVHPEVAKVLKSNQNDFLQELEQTLGKNVIVKSDPLLHQTKFDLA